MNFSNEDLSKLMSVARHAGMLAKVTLNTVLDTKTNRRDLVTRADLMSEEFIKGQLNDMYPGFAFFGEESYKSGQEIDPDVPTWLVDPLDGTTNFSQGLPFCAISIGLWFQGKPIAAVVYEIYLDRIFSAICGQGAKMDDKPIHVSNCQTIEKSFFAFDLPIDNFKRGLINPPLLSIKERVDNIRSLGCFVLTVCYIAAGIFDGYINVQCYPWDFGASKLILEEAGGEFDILTNNDSPAFMGCIASNRKIHNAIIDEMMNLL